MIMLWERDIMSWERDIMSWERIIMSWERDNYVVGTRSYVVGTRSYVKWRKVVAKILNMFKNFMRQNSSQYGSKVIAGVSNPSRTCRRPLAI